MSTALILITFFAHLVLPVIFLIWVGFNRGKNKLYRLLVALAVTSFLLIMWRGGAGWDWFGFEWPIVYLILLVPALIRLIKRSRSLPWLPERSFRPWAEILITVVVALTFVLDLPSFVTARKHPAETLSLEFPLYSGKYHVVHGGSSISTNHHFGVKAQRYALDIVKLGKGDVRANGLLPKDPAQYHIFGEPVYAPCSGEIIAVENTLEDQIPPTPDPKNLLGNYVTLYCDGHSVLLAHLKKGSVKVKVNSYVEKGVLLGEIGNSGNTSEPHLHIHAVKGRFTKTKEIAGTASPVPILFNGRFLVRNDFVNSKKQF